MTEKIPPALGKYETDSPETKEQAEELLKQYYKEHRGEKNLPRRPSLLSWKLYRDGSMTVVDGASGRKLEFGKTAHPASEEDHELEAELTLEDAEADAADAEAKASQARARVEELKAAEKAAKKSVKVEKNRESDSKIATTKA